MTNGEQAAQSDLTVGRMGDAGEMLDAQAKAACKRRTAELREQLEEARELNQLELVGRAGVSEASGQPRGALWSRRGLGSSKRQGFRGERFGSTVEILYWQVCSGRTLKISLVVIAILLGGCAAQQERVEQERKMVIQFNESQVMVVTGDLDQSYKILGQINYTEPVSGEAIDTNHVNARLRRMAIDQYQDQVDAIINVASTTDSSGGFEVSGEAVEIKGPCSFCRHKELVEVANDEANRSIAAPGGDPTGVWTGNLTFGCVSARARCLKQQDITFTFFQQETSVSGFYQCSSKDHPCLAHQYGGRIVRVENAPHGLLIKVRMDDGASCRFGAVTQERDEMRGVCICNELGGKPERGWWEVRRAY